MILRLEDVCKNYYHPSITIKVMKNISYEFQSGNIYVITGRKFAGKSILINLIGTLEEPTSGYITIDNISYIKKAAKDKAEVRSKYFGYVLPFLKLNNNLSIIENIMLPMYINTKMNDVDRLNKANQLLEYVGINSKRKIDINNLSDYDEIRILLARALANDPKIILIDDELDRLTSANQKEIMKLLRKIADEDKIIIITSNAKSIMENANQVLELKSGRL